MAYKETHGEGQEHGMTLTEEEAKTKRCQESFGQFYVTPAGGDVYGPTHMAAMAYPSQSFAGGAMWAVTSGGPQLPTVASPSHCIGGKCMAWQWHGKNPDETAFTGYCGKAGRP